MTDPRRMQNEEIIELLFSQEDRISRTVVDEIIRRGHEMLPTLSEIVMDRVLWVANLPEWWAPVHATYVLGTIGGKESLIPLLASLRWSDAYDNEWITEDLPSILGALGDISYPSLIAVVGDRSAGWSARSIAMDALGSEALRFPGREENVMAVLGKILRDKSDEFGARRSAAYVLMDFRRADYKKDLIGFAKAEENRRRQDPNYRPAFTPRDIERDLSAPRRGMDAYIRDWLNFYNEDEIGRRQEHWREEDGRMKPDFAAGAAGADRGGLVIGRNDPCPCGSGRPYKRCCWRKLH